MGRRRAETQQILRLSPAEPALTETPTCSEAASEAHAQPGRRLGPTLGISARSPPARNASRRNLSEIGCPAGREGGGRARPIPPGRLGQGSTGARSPRALRPGPAGGASATSREGRAAAPSRTAASARSPHGHASFHRTPGLPVPVPPPPSPLRPPPASASRRAHASLSHSPAAASSTRDGAGDSPGVRGAAQGGDPARGGTAARSRDPLPRRPPPGRGRGCRGPRRGAAPARQQAPGTAGAGAPSLLPPPSFPRRPPVPPLTAEAGVLLLGADLADLQRPPAERGQHQPLPQEVAPRVAEALRLSRRRAARHAAAAAAAPPCPPRPRGWEQEALGQRRGQRARGGAAAAGRGRGLRGAGGAACRAVPCRWRAGPGRAGPCQQVESVATASPAPRQVGRVTAEPS